MAKSSFVKAQKLHRKLDALFEGFSKSYPYADEADVILLAGWLAEKGYALPLTPEAWSPLWAISNFRIRRLVRARQANARRKMKGSSKK